MKSVHRLIRQAGGISAVGVIFDVGAHLGQDSIPIAREFPGVRVVAIEPTPSLARGLRESSQNMPNYTVIETAIDTVERQTLFNIDGSASRINSLNDFSPGIATSWKGMPSEPKERITLFTRRLETVCEELDIDSIDILHVDAQGSDIDVLISLGDRLELVKAGVIEVSNRKKLYTTSVNRDDAYEFLRSRNFRVFDIRPMDEVESEQNVFFVNRSIRRRRFLDASEGLVYRALVLRCSLIALFVRYTGSAKRSVQRLRVRLALRTRLRRWTPH